MKVMEFCERIGLPNVVLKSMPQIKEEECRELKKLYRKDRQKFYSYVMKNENWEGKFLSLYCQFACETYDIYKERGIEEDIFWNTFLDIRFWCENCYHEYGTYGIHEYQWFYRAFELKLFRLGRLQFEIMEELEEGFPVLSVHIPQGEPLRWEACRESVLTAYRWFGENRKYICHSWLLYPGLKDLLPAGSNILMFQNMFDIASVDYEDREAEWRIFGKVLESIQDYPENTSLQSNAKKYLLNGKKLGNGFGELRNCV